MKAPAKVAVALLSYVMVWVGVAASYAQLGLTGIGPTSSGTAAVIPAFVQGQMTPISTGNLINISATFGSPVGVGHLVVGHVTWGTNTTTQLMSVTNDKGESCTFQDATASVADSQTAAQFYCLNLTMGATVFTATFALMESFRGISIDEYSGVTTLDGHAAQFLTATTATDNAASPTITTTGPNDLVWGAAMLPSAMTQGTGYMLRNFITVNGAYATEDKIPFAAGTTASTFTVATGGRSVVFVQAFK